jgi:membrane fusion protein (multidrug efflux system)
VESAEIRTSSRSTPRLFVVEAGLSAGDQIVTEGLGGITDGAPIRPQAVSADSLYRALSPEPPEPSSATRMATAPDA